VEGVSENLLLIFVSEIRLILVGFLMPHGPSMVDTIMHARCYDVSNHFTINRVHGYGGAHLGASKNSLAAQISGI
jgi:hypothetical protein